MSRGRRFAVISVVIVATAVVYELGRSRPVVYAGLSVQRLPVKLTLAPDHTTLTLDVSWIAPCGVIERTVRRRAVKIAGNGDFSWQGTHVEDLHSDGDEERQRWRLEGRRNGDGTLSGVWSAESAFINGQGGHVDKRCSSGDVAFRVRRNGSVRRPAPRTDASGNLVIALDGQPRDVAVGAGRTWVLSRPSRNRTTVTAIDPQTGRAGAPLALGSVATYARGVFAAGEGAVWTFNEGPPFRLTRVDARTRRVLLGPRTPRSVIDWHYVNGLAVGAGGVWLRNGERVLRADPRSGRIVRSIRLAPDPRAPATRTCKPDIKEAGPVTVGTGAVWVTSTTRYTCRLVGTLSPSQKDRVRARCSSPIRICPERAGRDFHELSRIDPRTNRVTRTVALRHPYAALAAGPSGVWGVTCLTGPRSTHLLASCLHSQLHRISLRDGRPVVVTRLPARGVTGLAVSRDAVWISQGVEDESHGALRRLDPATRRLTTVLELEGLPTSVAIGEGGVWIVDTFARTLIRIPL